MGEMCSASFALWSLDLMVCAHASLIALSRGAAGQVLGTRTMSPEKHALAYSCKAFVGYRLFNGLCVIIIDNSSQNSCLHGHRQWCLRV